MQLKLVIFFALISGAAFSFDLSPTATQQSQCSGLFRSLARRVIAPARNLVVDTAAGMRSGFGRRVIKEIRDLNLPEHALKQLAKIVQRKGASLQLTDLDLITDLPIETRAKLFKTLVEARERQGLHLFFTIIQNDKQIPFERDPKTTPPEQYLKARILKAIEEAGTGTGGSHLLNGTREIHDELTEAIARFTNTESAFLLSSGEHAHGWPTAWAKRGDLVLVARDSSQTLLETLENAATYPGTAEKSPRNYYQKSFIYNRLDEIEKAAENFYSDPKNKHRNLFVALPSKSYKTGEVAKLKEILAITSKYQNIKVVLDETLALGELGPNKAGLAAQENLTQHPQMILSSSLFDPFGADVGFLAGPEIMTKHARHYFRHHMFSTSASPADSALALGQIELAQAQSHLLPRPVQKSVPIHEPDIPTYPGLTDNKVGWKIPGVVGTTSGITTSSNAYLNAQTAEPVKSYTKEIVLALHPVANMRQAIHSRLQRELSKFFGANHVVLTRSGFDANLVLKDFANPGDLILMDEQVHASAREAVKAGIPLGVRNGEKTHFYTQEFSHNSVSQARKYLTEFLNDPRNTGKKVILTLESVYSMAGDTAKKEIVDLAKEFPDRVHLIIDDAHGIGVIGNNGRGALNFYGIQDQKNATLVGTGSKALGSKFGFVATQNAEMAKRFEEKMAERYRGKSPVGISNAAAGYAALKLLEKQPERVAQLQRNRDRLRSGLYHQGIDISLTDKGAIIPVRAAKGVDVISLQKELNRAKWFGGTSIQASVAAPPAVPKELGPILRFSVTADMTDAQIDSIVREILKLKSRLMLRENNG